MDEYPNPKNPNSNPSKPYGTPFKNTPVLRALIIY